MNTKHTPGPWIPLVTRIDDASGYQLCHLDLHGKSEAERDANRRLIAAAPELLQALESMLGMHEEGATLHGLVGPTVEAARAAIAKATGGEA